MQRQRHMSQAIDETDLPLFLAREEGPTLEFKREWYKLEGDPETRNRHKDELAKDILALANGNAESAGEVALLIVGAGDERGEDGERQLYDQGDFVPTPVEILQIVRTAANPPMGTIDVVPFTIGETRLFALVIPPSPHLYETTRNLRTPSQEFSKHLVFIRRGETVDIATARERDAIKKLKEVRLAEARNAPPMLFGGAVGATIAGIILARIGERTADGKKGMLAGGVVGAIFGGLFGALMGTSYEAILQAARASHRLPSAFRRQAIPASALIVILSWIASDRVGNFIIPNKTPLKPRAPSRDQNISNQTGK